MLRVEEDGEIRQSLLSESPTGNSFEEWKQKRRMLEGHSFFVVGRKEGRKLWVVVFSM
jgi:hypothetical protein